ncbi:MAG: L-lactate dehydrogenase [Agromyces sp.]
MHTPHVTKLSVVGAGAVGSSTAYAALIRGSAGLVALTDIDEARAHAEVLDLQHGTQFTGSSRMLDDVSLDGTANSDVVVITAGAKQKPGESRLALVQTNVRIIESLMPQLVERSPKAKFVIVSNPCDVLATVAQRISGLPENQVFASGTVLDSSRLRVLLGQRAGVAPSSVHAYIVGEHGDSEFPLWSSASIGTVPILDWQSNGPRFTIDELAQTADDVRNAAYAIIQGKGATNYAIGLSAARIVEAILGDENAVLPVSTVLNGQYGVSGVALSVPHLVNRDGAFPIPGVPFSTTESAQFSASANTLLETLASVGYAPST